MRSPYTYTVTAVLNGEDVEVDLSVGPAEAPGTPFAGTREVDVIAIRAMSDGENTVTSAISTSSQSAWIGCPDRGSEGTTWALVIGRPTDSSMYQDWCAAKTGPVSGMPQKVSAGHSSALPTRRR